jgi:(p)ppGpp synthase/HD superfamily hydrolase
VNASDAYRAHQLVQQLYENRPERLVHVHDVAGVLREMGTTAELRIWDEAEVFVAAYLHDVLDDVVITRPELRDALGEEALKLADDLSENFVVGCARRCTFFENLPALRASPVALEVRLAARFANWRQALETGDDHRRAWYRKDYLLFRSELIKLPVKNPQYWLRLDGLMDELPEASWEVDGVRHFGIVTPGVDFR